MPRKQVLLERQYLPEDAIVTKPKPPRKQVISERQFLPEDDTKPKPQTEPPQCIHLAPEKPKVKKTSHAFPWGAESLDEFLFYCCPECDMKFKDCQNFLDHARLSHEDSGMEAEDDRNQDEFKIIDPLAFENNVRVKQETSESKDSEFQPVDLAAFTDSKSTDSEDIEEDSEWKPDEEQVPEVQSLKKYQKPPDFTKLSNEKFQCNECEDQLEPRKLDSHRHFVCKACGFESINVGGFKKHVDSIKHCKKCSKVFCGSRSAESFRRHQKRHEYKPTSATFCVHCNKTFEYASKLKQHLVWSKCGRK